MIDAGRLLADTRTQVVALVDSLRTVAATDGAAAHVAEEHRRASAAGRTALGPAAWAEGVYAQVAVAWVLGGVFVRFCEDNKLIAHPLLGGTGIRASLALDQRAAHLQTHPAHDDRHWLREVFARLRALPATGEVFGAHNPVWVEGGLLVPTADTARTLRETLTGVDPGTGQLRHDFTDPTWDTRFLGDLYQNLSDHAKKTYALLQTPRFVEAFILDRTLEPALAAFGLAATTVIDPTCGSGHFLLGAFERLVARWADAPAYEIHIAVGDALLHGDPPGRLPGMHAPGEEAMVAAHGYQAEAVVVPTLVDLSVADTARAMQRWAAQAEATLDDGEPKPEPESSLHLSSTLGGRWALDGDLDPLSGEVLDTALRLADDARAEGEPRRTPAQRRAQGLVDICQFFLDRRDHPAGSRHRPHINLVVGLDDIRAGRGGKLPDRVVLDGPSTASLVCDSVLHRVLMAGSTILDHGAGTRTISPALFNALVVRDRHCRFPGCDRPAAWCDCHHVVHVEHGGSTCPENACLLCRRHHTRLHRPGWSATMAADGELVVTDPDGRAHTSRPPDHGPRPPPALFAA